MISHSDYIFIISSYFLAALSIFIFIKYNFSNQLLKGYYVFLSPLIYIHIFIFTFFGSIIAIFLTENITRLTYISEESISVYQFFVTYSTLILFLILIPFLNKKNTHSPNFISYIKNSSTLSSTKIIFLLLVISIYVTFKYIYYFDHSPIITSLLYNNNLLAESLRFEIQTKKIITDIPYFSKMIEILSFYIVITSYIQFRIYKENHFMIIFLISVIFTGANFLFDLQKAPLILLVLSLLLVETAISNNKKIIYTLVGISIITLIVIYSLFSKIDSTYLTSFISILDRTLIGQNQGFYYIYDYLPINYNNFSNWISSNNFIHADQEVIRHMKIYAGNPNIVNTNTYYLAEAWYSFGMIGLIFTPIIISFSILIVLLIVNYLLRYNYFLFFPLALYTFLSIPITRSFYQMITFKYFIYIIFFGVIPIYIFNKINLRKA